MENERADAGRDGPTRPYRETEFSGANGDRENIMFPVQLTTSRVGNHSRLIHTLSKVFTIHVGVTMLLLLLLSSH